MDKVGQLNTHTYSGTNEERREVHQLVMATGKEFWQSETGPGGWKERASGLKNNLLLTKKMFNDLNLMQPQAWLDWQLMEESNDTWCLIRCNFQTQTYDMVKNLYVRMQITKFIKQGYTLVVTGNESALVAINEENTKLVVALNNPTEDAKPFTLNLDNIVKTANEAEIYRTSPTENCKQLPPVSIENSQINYSAPALSLTTFVIQIN
jgi:O-glycosyl hydrolase